MGKEACAERAAEWNREAEILDQQADTLGRRPGMSAAAAYLRTQAAAAKRQAAWWAEGAR